MPTPKPILYLLPTFAYLAGTKVTTITKDEDGERVSSESIEDGKLDVCLVLAEGNRPAWHEYLEQPDGAWDNPDVVAAVAAMFPQYEVVLRYPERTDDLTEEE